MWTDDLLASLREAVIETDADFRVVRWNRAAEAMYGWRAAEVEGRHVWDVVRSRISDQERERLIGELRSTGHVLPLVTQLTREDTPLEVEASVIALSDGQGYASVSRDVSLRRRLETRLEETRHLELV